MQRFNLAVLASSCLGLAVAASNSNAAIVTVAQGPYSFGTGGEFIATSLDLPAPAVSINGSPTVWESFCMELSENFGPNQPYQFTLDTYAAGGGGGAVAGQDPLDDQSAYIYAQFITGALPSYDYTNGLGQRQADAGALQNVLWFIEQEMGTLDTPKAVFFYNLSLAGIGQGIGDVRVVNMFELDGQGLPVQVQSQIVMVPEPASAAVLAVAGLAAIRRRRSL